jgi:hypothetical protein
MNRTAPRSRPRSVNQISNEACGLVQQQIDALQEGLAEDDLKEYLERRGHLDELQAQLRALCSRSSSMRES